MAAAAAKLLQSCPTLCDPIDSSLPGSPIPGILQARILEQVAIFFSNAYMHAKSLQLCPTLRPYGQQPTRLLCPLDSLRKNTGEDCHFLLQEIFPTQGLNLPLLWLLHCRQILYHWAIRESLCRLCECNMCFKILMLVEMSVGKFYCTFPCHLGMAETLNLSYGPGTVLMPSIYFWLEVAESLSP